MNYKECKTKWIKCDIKGDKVYIRMYKLIKYKNREYHTCIFKMNKDE